MDTAKSRQEFVGNRRDLVNIFLAVTAPLVFFWPYIFGIHGVFELICYLILLVVWVIDNNYRLHLHAHRPFTNSSIANRVLDICLGSVTGMTSANWRIQHVFGHHRGNDLEYTRRSLDWTMESYSVSGALLYSFGNIWVTFWHPIVESYHKGIVENTKEPINYRAAFVEQIGFILFVVTLAFFEPRLTFSFLLPWYILVFGITRYVDYLNHYGCTEEALNFANNCLNRSFNWRINNFGYHTAHHIDPGAHWTTLPQLHAKIAEQIPAARIKTFDWSSALFPYHAWCERRQMERLRR